MRFFYFKTFWPKYNLELCWSPIWIKCSDIYLFIILWSSQKYYPFQDKRHTILNMIKFVISPRNAELFIKRCSFFISENWAYVLNYWPPKQRIKFYGPTQNITALYCLKKHWYFLYFLLFFLSFFHILSFFLLLIFF